VLLLDTRPDHENHARELSRKVVLLETVERAFLLPMYAVVLERKRHVSVCRREGRGGYHRGPVLIQNEGKEKTQSMG
jgi:hypothetical protein